MNFMRPLIRTLVIISFLTGLMTSAQALTPTPHVNTVWETGPITVFSISDRSTEMDISLFKGPATPEQRAAYFQDGKTPAAVNTFLIRFAGSPVRHVLVDTGYGHLMDGGQVIQGLERAGVGVQDIDIVLLTHMHPDHIGGLLLGDGTPVFPKAQIMVSQPEYEYWTNIAASDSNDATAKLVQAVVDAYGSRVLPGFAFKSEILPGVSSVDARGHTPGHTAFRLESDGRALMIVGDLVHAATLQFPLPQECASYDMNPDMAIESRLRLLNEAAEHQTPIVGMHIPSPGAGTVKKTGDGFEFTPIP